MNFTIGANPAGIPRTGTLTVAGQTFSVNQQAAGCSSTINPTSQSVAAAGGPGTAIAVTATPGCAWTATSGATWITNVTPDSGTGNGTVNFIVGGNPAGIPRTGTLTVAGQTFSINQQAAECSSAINPTSQTSAAAGGGMTIGVTATPGCAWTATSGASWITNVTPGSGTGNGTVNFIVGANPAGTPRTGTLTVAGQTFSVNQQAAGCSFAINPTSQTAAAAAGGMTIGVIATPGCAWTATSGASWITNVTPGSGTGNGTVNFIVGANPAGIPRTGTLTVAGQTFTVNQQAAGCSFAINPTSQSAAAGGGAGTAIAVTATPGCAWTAASGATWITNVTPGSGTGNGTVNFTIGANPAGTPRTGTLTVAGQTFSVNQQAAGCSYSINPTSQSVAAGGGAGTAIAVTATPGCAWTAASGATWITNVTPGSGTGNGTVNFTIGANPAGTPRTGTLTVAGQTFSVNQQAAGCSFSINPTSQSVAAGGGAGTAIGVTATPGCAWTAASGASWITNVTPGSGTGNGTVNFTIGANPAGTPRTGTLTVAGQTFSVNQQAAGCSYSINPTSQSVAAGGGAGTAIGVTATPGCAWTAASGASWITNVTPGSGTGNGTVNFTIGANPAGTPRTGTLTVAGQTFSVNQQAAECSYSINPTSQSVPAAGGPGTAIAVTATSGCAWTATSDASWITNVTPGSGSGNGLVNFTVAVNTGPARTGSLTIAGRRFTVTQANGCMGSGCAPGGQIE